jgi:hypothetical protein
LDGAASPSTDTTSPAEYCALCSPISSWLTNFKDDMNFKIDSVHLAGVGHDVKAIGTEHAPDFLKEFSACRNLEVLEDTRRTQDHPFTYPHTSWSGARRLDSSAS